MGENNRINPAKIEGELQKEYKRYFLSRWQECVDKRLQTRLVISFADGRVTSIQDQAIIAGSSVLDIYGKKMLD